MFLNLKHKTLDIYQATREFNKEIHKVSLRLPNDERYNLTQQIKRAALSVKLNLAEGSARKSELERKRYYEISRASIVDIDAALETAVDIDYYVKGELETLGLPLNKYFAMLSKMIST